MLLLNLPTQLFYCPVKMAPVNQTNLHAHVRFALADASKTTKMAAADVEQSV